MSDFIKDSTWGNNRLTVLGQPSPRRCLQLLSITTDKLKLGNKNKTPGRLGLRVRVGSPLGRLIQRWLTEPWSGGQAKLAGIDYSVSSDIHSANLTVYLQSYIFIHRLPACPSPPQLGGSSGARRGELLFLHVHDSVSVHLSTCPSPVASLPCKCVSLSSMSEIRFCYYLFTFKPSEKAQSSDPFTDSDQFLLPAHMFFLLCGCVFGFLLPCQHVLCISLCVLRCIGLYFVPLSGLLITSILSLKCNYVHHVLFLVGRRLVREAERGPWALAQSPPMENKNMLWRWVAETCCVSH